MRPQDNPDDLIAALVRDGFIRAGRKTRKTRRATASVSRWGAVPIPDGRIRYGGMLYKGAHLTELDSARATVDSSKGDDA